MDTGDREIIRQVGKFLAVAVSDDTPRGYIMPMELFEFINDNFWLHTRQQWQRELREMSTCNEDYWLAGLNSFKPPMDNGQLYQAKYLFESL